MTYSNTQMTRQNISKRAQNIIGWLGQFNALYIFLAVVYVLLMLASLGALGSVLGGVGMVATGIELLVGIVVLALYFLAIRAAQKAIRSVGSFADQGSAPTGTAEDIQRLNAWLTAGQWLGVVSAALSVLMSLLAAGSVPQDPAMPGAAGLGLIGILPVVFISVAGALLSWLIYGAIKGFFASVLERSRGGTQAVTPSAERAASWLQFVIVVQWIGAVLAGLGLLATTLLVAFKGGLDTAYGIGVLVGQVTMLAFVGWVIALAIRLMGHSRLFALEVGQALDHPQHLPAGTAPTPDPWGER